MILYLTMLLYSHVQNMYNNILLYKSLSKKSAVTQLIPVQITQSASQLSEI